jgi:hypothetical protein
MWTEELIKNAKSSLNGAQNYQWNSESDITRFVELCMMDAQTRALLAIAQELKRMNDNNDTTQNKENAG